MTASGPWASGWNAALGPDPRAGPSGSTRGAKTPGLGRAAGLELLGACSSVGQSARLISVRSAVQIGPGPPNQMSDDGCQMTEGAGGRHGGRRLQDGRLLACGIRGHRNGIEIRCRRRMSEKAAGAREGSLRHLSSVVCICPSGRARGQALCSYDIVKRVVTVKQVRPSCAGVPRDEVGPGHGYVLPVREHRQGRCSRTGPRTRFRRGCRMDRGLRAQAEGLGAEPSDI
jgi:hypothetical protein